MAYFVGVDGCRAGWFVVCIDEAGAWEYAVLPEIASVWARYADAERILIDIPIGFAEAGRRHCEDEARNILGARRSSVFSVPVRAALYAETYADASAINHGITGLKLSKQTWNIMPKMCEVDILMRADARARETFAETHPEVLFYGLAGAPMSAPKKTQEGFAERLSVLRQSVPDVDTLIMQAMGDFRRSQVARDDIVDALVIAIVARMGNCESLPAEPDRDAHGLPMRIVYCRT